MWEELKSEKRLNEVGGGERKSEREKEREGWMLGDR